MFGYLLCFYICYNYSVVGCTFWKGGELNGGF